MKEAQAQAIINLINTLDLQGKPYIKGSDDDGWYVIYWFRRDGEIADYDLITTVAAFHRWLSYRGKEALVGDEE